MLRGGIRRELDGALAALARELEREAPPAGGASR
jgi:hypothetical protein